MNHQNDITTREMCNGVVECRICGLKFCPDLEEDRDLHEQEHRRILWGGVPYDVREFVKQAARSALRENRRAEDEDSRRAREIAKRAMVFAWWARAISNGIPENDFEPYMEAHFAFVDALASGDTDQIVDANHAIARWQNYGS